MAFSKDFSVIVPCWRGAIKFLPKLFDSIPQRDGIEIIVVDNSKDPVRREEIKSDRNIVFLNSAHDRHAGGSRNDGMDAAQGKWLIFADADDYFAPGAFDVFYSKLDSDAELIFTKPDGIYDDTGEHSDRADYYAQLVHRYCVGELKEYLLRIRFITPWSKMVSHELVVREKLRYDEIRAGNDIYFSLTSGYYASKIEAIDTVTYITTVNRGSLTKLKDYEVIKARLYSRLHYNEFLRQHGLSKYQYSVMFALAASRHYGINKTWEFVKMIVRFRQNPFIGYKRWFGTARNSNAKDEKYFVN